MRSGRSLLHTNVLGDPVTLLSLDETGNLLVMVLPIVENVCIPWVDSDDSKPLVGEVNSPRY